MAFSSFLFACAIFFCLQATPAAAFGAGNIASMSSIEGENFRHGDIEDTLLKLVVSAAAGGGKFSKLDVKRVYFGNWLRDYSQAVDVGGLKNVSAEAIRIILWVLGFITFGYGSREFEVTKDRLGCYRPEEHIDNPKDYNDNEDATRYDSRLRKPVEDKELDVDSETGLKNYIANEKIGIDTSGGLVRKLLTKSIELGRKFAKDKKKEDWCEALRLLGTATHCLEDYSAHSNYIELALIELGEDNVFPHVGRDTAIDIPNAGNKYPLVTGTFGATDFLHSVCGEVSDKAVQSEIQELEGTFENAAQEGPSASFIQGILDKIPAALIGGEGKKDEAAKLQENAEKNKQAAEQVNPREPEEWTKYLNQISKEQLLPVMEFHDDIMKNVTTTIEGLPILPELLEELQDALNVFIFSLIAPFILPVIKQVKSELETGSTQIIQNAREQQHKVFEDAGDSNPSHSMLSKDHFTNILNPPAGRIACAVLNWTVPQIIECYNDTNKDANAVVDGIIRSVFHHPAQRGDEEGRKKMFEAVQEWWESKDDREKDSLREQLSKEGVREGKNHKEGEHDTGHGSHKPLGMARLGPGSSGRGGPPTGVVAGVDVGKKVEEVAEQATGSGIFGAIAGGLAGGFTKAFQQVHNENEEAKEGESGSGRRQQQQQQQQQQSRRDDNESSSGYGGAHIGGNRRDDNDNERSIGGYGGSHIGGSRRDDNESSSGYGRTQRDDNESSSYGRTGRDDNEGSSSYGRNRRDDNESSGYGLRRDDNESSGYGSGRTRRDEEESSSGYGRSGRDDNESSGYGGGSTYSSRRDDNESSGYGGGSTYSSRRDDNESSGYGGGSTYSSRRDDNESYGGGSTYSSRRDDDDNQRGSGRGDYIREDTGNRSRRDDQEAERMQESYGRMQLGGADEGRSRSGQYAERQDDEDNNSYGRRRNDDNDNEYGSGRREGGYRRDDY